MTSLSEFVREKPAEEDTARTIQKFIETTKESSIKRVENMIGAQLLQLGLFKEFHEIINRFLEQYALGENVRTEKECMDLAEVVWKELVSAVDGRYTYTSIQTRIAEDIKTVYANYPDAYGRYMSREMPELENKEAYQSKGRGEKIKTKFHMNPTLKPLKERDFNELKNYMNSLPDIFVREHQIVNFSPNLMSYVRKSIEEAITIFEVHAGVSLLGAYKWEVHVYALKKFGLLFHRLERKWESANHPKKVLEKNEDVYKGMIVTRLRHGFSASGEGYVISDVILNAVAQKAIKHGSETRVNKVLDLPWIVNSENVRLKFFGHLAKKVSEDDFDEAVKFFFRPEKKITEWFKKEVNSKYNDESAESSKTTFETELDFVVQNVRNKQSMAELKQYLDDYCTQVGCVPYQQSPTEEENPTGENLSYLKSSIEQGIRNRQVEFLRQITLQLEEPSESDVIMARIGCTEHCYWCGALCWGQRGHSSNQDSTKNHHACHQPAGLIGTTYHGDKTLVEKPCQDRKDDIKVFWGDCKATGMAWSEAKKHANFKNWLFDQHTKVEFNQLMYWFFKKLNNPLANRKAGGLPAPDSVFQSGAYESLNSTSLEQILAAISQQVLAP